MGSTQRENRTSDEETRTATLALQRLGHGDLESAEQLMPLVYDRLRRTAGRWFKGHKSGTLQPTALVHEAYLHLIDQTAVSWQDRAHFFALAAKVMRQLLIQHARRRNSLRAGGQFKRAELELDALSPVAEPEDLVGLHEALERLAKLHERQAQVVELRFFGGLTGREAAEVLGIPERTADQDWRTARAWLRATLGSRERP